MDTLSQRTTERIGKLGFTQEAPVPNDRLVSATAALACVPMYMVSNVHGWTGDREFRLLHVKGSEAVRESYVIGERKADLPLDEAHDRVLRGFTDKDHPSDLIVYEHALETLRVVLDEAQPALADELRRIVASGVVAVARAAGKGMFGSGEKVSPEERECIATIREVLELDASSEARTALSALD